MPQRPLSGKPGPFLRILYRLPQVVYQAGAGALLGHRFLMVVHRGRRTGRLHRTVLEVVRYDAARQEAVVVAGYGSQADWYRNLCAAPALEVHIGNDRYVPEQRLLSKEEAVGVLADYERRHPRLLRLFFILFRIPYDGSPAARRAVVARMPMVAFRPAR